MRVYGFLLASWLVTPCAQAQLLVELSPDQIREAIETGQAGEGQSLDDYAISFGRRPRVAVETPYMRVLAAAREARQQGRSFGPANVTAAMKRAAFSVVVLPYLDGEDVYGEVPITSPAINILRVVAEVPANGATRAIAPVRSKRLPYKWSNAFGAAKDGYGLDAEFPLSILKAGTTLWVVTTDHDEKFVVTDEFLARIR